MPAMEYRQRNEDASSAQHGMHEYHGRAWGGSSQAREHTAVYDLDGARAVPEFEQEAVRFEQLLGAWAFREGESLSGRVCQSVIDYVSLHYTGAQPLAEDLADKLDQLSTLLPALGNDSLRYAGAVGTGADAIAGVILQGNTRERMLVVQSFVYNYLNQDMADQDKLAELRDRADEALGIQWEIMEQAQATGDKPWETGTHNRGQTEVANGDIFRAKRSQDIQAIDINTVTYDELRLVRGVGPVRAQAIIDFRASRPGPIRMEDLLQVRGIGQATVDAIRSYQPPGWGRSEQGPTLPAEDQRGTGQAVGQFEAQHQQQTGGVAVGQPMQWSNPSADMVMNEANEWVQQQREVGNPLLGGPSGHTHKFMMVNQVLGLPITPDEMRLVSMGHLMPINCHTAIEVAEAAKPFGATPYPHSPTWYRHIAPQNEGLKSAIGATRWPDEVLTEDQRRFAAQQQVPTQDLTLVPRALRDRVEVRGTIPAPATEPSSATGTAATTGTTATGTSGASSATGASGATGGHGQS